MIIELMALILPILGIMVTWILNRQYQSSSSAAKLLNSGMGLVDRLERQIEFLSAESTAWRRYANQLTEQIYNLGHDPAVDEPAIGTDIELINALISAFNLASFDRMLQLQCNREREEISTANGLRQIIFEVVGAAERENWMNELKQGALAANSSNQMLRELIN